MLFVLIILRVFDLYVIFAPHISRSWITNSFLVFSYTNQTLGDIIYILQLFEWIVMINIIKAQKNKSLGEIVFDHHHSKDLSQENEKSF